MKRGILGALAIGLLLSGQALAETGATQAVDPLKVQALQVPLTDTAQAALRELYTERDAFVGSFDWGTREQLVEKQASFQREVRKYEVRGHVIMRDMYKANGHDELATFEQTRIEQLEKTALVVPTTDNPTVPALNGKEVQK
jgi:hypothetical protein